MVVILLSGARRHIRSLPFDEDCFDAAILEILHEVAIVVGGIMQQPSHRDNTHSCAWLEVDAILLADTFKHTWSELQKNQDEKHIFKIIPEGHFFLSDGLLDELRGSLGIII